MFSNLMEELILPQVGFAKERNDKYKDMKPLPLTIQRSIEV